MVGVVSGFTALFVRKGSRLHRKSGKVFAISMLLMAATGGFMAILDSQRLNTLAGVFTFYLVATAWLTVRRRGQHARRAELCFLLMALAAGVAGWAFGIEAAGRKAGGTAGGCFVFGSLAFLAGIGDIRMLIRGGVSGAQRLVRHVWRMCFALFIAAGSFFLGQSGNPVFRQSGLRARLFPAAVRETHLPAVPVLLIIVLMIFWVIRVRFGSAYKNVAERAR
jgi:hypothetical protein